jgi:hypothetical protein
MSNLSEKSQVICHIALDYFRNNMETSNGDMKKLLAEIGEAKSELGYPTRRIEVLIQKYKEEFLI